MTPGPIKDTFEQEKQKHKEKVVLYLAKVCLTRKSTINDSHNINIFFVNERQFTWK